VIYLILKLPNCFILHLPDIFGDLPSSSARDGALYSNG
jgi:hypothetical protein